MADDTAVVADDYSKIVTGFFLATCLQQPSKHNVWAAVICGQNARGHESGDNTSYSIPLITGSTAELHIQPMLSCIGDVDVMFHFSNILAIPADHPPPESLPAEFHGLVRVCEIIDSEFPGYVFLKLRYMLKECIDDGKYHVDDEHVDSTLYARYVQPNYANAERHGPAHTIPSAGKMLSIDRVVCVRCLLWPKQAADWPTRHRNYGWPDSATLDRVVSNGCDIVHVAHRLCRQHEWLSKHQCRLSFSRAEIVLLNTWMPVQQIVYHMLRIFVKTDKQLTVVNEKSGSKTLSNYHIKTLMLWAAELETRNSWSTDMNVVKICAKLLRTLSVWLNNSSCQHYFINSNLVDNTFNLEIIVSHLMSLSDSWLSAWFINNYLRKCSEICPDRLSRLFNNISTSIKLQNAVSAVVNWRLDNVIPELCDVLYSATWHITRSFERLKPTAIVRSCTYLMRDLAKVDSRLTWYLTAVTFLHVAYKIPMLGFNDELMDVLATILGQNVGRRRYFSQHSVVAKQSNQVDESHSE